MSLFDAPTDRRDWNVQPALLTYGTPDAAREPVAPVGAGASVTTVDRRLMLPPRDRDQSARVRRVVLSAMLVDGSWRRPSDVRALPPSLTCGPFTYSMATVRLVRAGLTPATSPLGRFLAVLSSDEGRTGAETDEDACALLTKRWVLMLATLAEVLTAMGANSCPLDGRSGFSLPVDELLRDRVTVPPRSFREFSEALYLDIRSSLVDRGAIEFAFGRLELMDRRVTLTVSRSGSDEPRLGGRITVLE